MRAFAALIALALTAQAPPPAAAPRPITCILDRLDQAYLSGLWARIMSGGIPAGDPALGDFNTARDACRQQHGWPENMLTHASFYAMARANSEVRLREKLPVQADRDLLVRAVLDFTPPHIDILSRDPEGAPLATAAKAEFRTFLERANPDLMRRFDYEDLWSAAMPRIVAEIMHMQFAFARDLG